MNEKEVCDKIADVEHDMIMQIDKMFFHLEKELQKMFDHQNAQLKEIIELLKHE